MNTESQRNKSPVKVQQSSHSITQVNHKSTSQKISYQQSSVVQKSSNYQYTSPPPQQNPPQTFTQTVQTVRQLPAQQTTILNKSQNFQQISPQNFQQISPNIMSLSGIRQQSYVRMVSQQPIQQVQQTTQQSYIQPVTSSIVYHQQPQPQPQPIVQYLVERIERPLQVVDLTQYELMWQKRIQDLESQLKGSNMASFHPQDNTEYENKIEELQGKLQDKEESKLNLNQQVEILKGQLVDERQSNDYYIQQTQQLQNQIEDLKRKLISNDQSGQLGELQLQSKNLQNADLESKQKLKDLEGDLKSTTLTVERYRQENEQLRSEKQYFKDLSDERDLQIQDLQDELEEVRQSQEEHVETTTHYLTNEVSTWKNKFIELNNKFHQVQEDFMLCQAELEHIKQQKSSQQITVSTTEVRSSNTKSQSQYKNEAREERRSVDVRQGSEYERSALDQNDLEKLKKLEFS